jgi:hypothetical protein
MKRVGSLVVKVLNTQYTDGQAKLVQMRFCQTCLDFSNLYAAKTEELLAATSDMARIAGIGKREAFEPARVEVQRLRDECDSVKADIKRHQSERGHA